MLTLAAFSRHSREGGNPVLLSVHMSRASTRQRRAGYFSLLAQREVTKRNAPPTPRLAHCAREVPCASRLRRPLTTAHPCADARRSRSLAIALRVSPAPPAMLGALKGAQDQGRNQKRSGAPALHLISGLLLPRRAHGGKLDRVARRKRASSLHVYGRTFNEPRNAIANLPGEARQAWHRGRLSFAYFSLAKQRKVSRSAEGRAEVLLYR